MSVLFTYLYFNFDVEMINRDVETNQLFGSRLREERIMRGLSQHQLWLASGIVTSQIGKIERGVANPTLSTIVALSRALQVSVDVLLPLEKIR